MSFWDIFKPNKKKLPSGPLTLRMGDKKYLVSSYKEKPKGKRTMVLSVANQGFVVVGEFEKTTKQIDNLGKVPCYRLACLETGRSFTIEKEIFDRLFVAY